MWKRRNMKINAEEGKGWKEEKGVNRVCVAMAGPSLGATTGTTRGHWDLSLIHI